MSTIKVNTIDNEGGAVDFPNKLTVRGNAIERTYTSSGTEPSSPSNGDFWYDTGNDVLKHYINSEFKTVSFAAQLVNGGDRAVHHGGYSASLAASRLDYYAIPTTGNAADFGDLLIAQRGYQNGGISNKSRGVYSVSYNSTKDLNYITFATTGSAADFGDMTYGIITIAAGSNGTLGLINFSRYANSGFYFSPSHIDKLTIATAANCTDFGYDFTTARGDSAGLSDGTTFVVAGGTTTTSASSNVNTIEKITFDSSSNSSDFGDLTGVRYNFCGAANVTYGLFFGGQASGANSNIIDYITVATAGNATDFGDLTAARQGPTACCNADRATVAGGYEGSTVDTIEYVTIASTGNATDFGNLVGESFDCNAASGNAS